MWKLTIKSICDDGVLRMVKDSNKVHEHEERRKSGSDAKMRSKLIDEELEKRLMEVTGLTKSDLYNRRGGLSERGLAALLEPGDTIVEVLDNHVVIQTKDGTRQTYWNLNRELPFLRSCTSDDKDTKEVEGGRP